MARRLTVVALLMVALLTLAFRPAAATGNYDVTRVLTELRSLNDTEFGQVVTWARGLAGRPSFVFSRVEAAENNIVSLHPSDRGDILSWLRGHGRRALHLRSISDAEIGPRRAGVDAGAPIATAPAQNPWREIKLAAATLTPEPSGGIAILRGFAAAKRDGTGATACITFRNVGTKVATRILFEFPLLNDEGGEVGALKLDRRGTFSPNVDIVGYGEIEDLAGNRLGPRAMADNCAKLELGTAAIPILAARLATYRIARVEYTDGTNWPEATAR